MPPDPAGVIDYFTEPTTASPMWEQHMCMCQVIYEGNCRGSQQLFVCMVVALAKTLQPPTSLTLGSPRFGHKGRSGGGERPLTLNLNPKRSLWGERQRSGTPVRCCGRWPEYLTGGVVRYRYRYRYRYKYRYIAMQRIRICTPTCW